jgi:hypothetical protein
MGILGEKPQDLEGGFLYRPCFDLNIVSLGSN